MPAENIQRTSEPQQSVQGVDLDLAALLSRISGKEYRFSPGSMQWNTYSIRINRDGTAVLGEEHLHAYAVKGKRPVSTLLSGC
jgi:hypothetical protein